MKKANVWVWSLFSLAFLFVMLPSVSSFVYNASRNVHNVTTDVNQTASVNITLSQSNQSVDSNASGNSLYVCNFQTLTVNATKIFPTWAANDTSRIEVNLSLNGGVNYIANVTSGGSYSWNNAFPANNYTCRVGLYSVGTLVRFNGVNITWGINITSTQNLTTQNIRHPNTTTSRYVVEWNTTRSSAEAVTYAVNNTNFNINGTGSVNHTNNVSASGITSLLLTASSLETMEKHNFTYNLSNNAFRALSVTLSPSSTAAPGQTVACSVSGTDDDNDQIATTYYTWWGEGTKLTDRTPNIAADTQYNWHICESVLWDGNLNSTATNSTSVLVQLRGGGGGGGGGPAPDLPVVVSPRAEQAVEETSSRQTAPSPTGIGQNAVAETINNIVQEIMGAIQSIITKIMSALGV